MLSSNKYFLQLLFMWTRLKLKIHLWARQSDPHDLAWCCIRQMLVILSDKHPHMWAWLSEDRNGVYHINYHIPDLVFLGYFDDLPPTKLKLKLQYFGHLMWKVDSLEKTLMLRGIGGRRRRGWQRMRWLGGITDSMDTCLSKLREFVMDRGLACYDTWGRKESDTTEWLN